MDDHADREEYGLAPRWVFFLYSRLYNDVFFLYVRFNEGITPSLSRGRPSRRPNLHPNMEAIRRLRPRTSAQWALDPYTQLAEARIPPEATTTVKKEPTPGDNGGVVDLIRACLDVLLGEEGGVVNGVERAHDLLRQGLTAMSSRNPDDTSNPPAGGIPQFLLSPALRLLFLRIVVASVLALFGLAMYDIKHSSRQAVGMVSTAIAMIHNVGTAFGPRIFPIPLYCDITLTVAEIAGHVYVASLIARHNIEWQKVLNLNLLGYMSNYSLLTYFGHWLLSASLTILLALKVFHMISTWHTHSARARLDIAGLRQHPWWKHLVQALLGTEMWSPNVAQVGESNWLALVRGALAAIFVCVLAAFGFYIVVIAPISEIGMRPYRQYRAASIVPPTFEGAYRNRIFKVVLVQNQRPGAIATLSSAVTVVCRWGTSEQPPETCRVENATLRWQQIIPTWDVAVATCPQPLPGETNTVNPTFDITVNHRGLAGDTPDWALSSISVYLGLTSDIEKVFYNTEAIVVVQGTRLLAIVGVMLRQLLKPVGLATLGFENSERFLVASIKQTMPDPRPTPETDLTTSMLRIVMEDITPEVNVVQDYRSKSVITGFSFVGGLGSFLSTLLAILLGTSLMGAVIRSKPHSPFGFLHNIRSLQVQMVAECEKMYPRLRKDIEELEKNAGAVAYILHTLLDMEAMGYSAQIGRGRESNDVAQLPRTDDEETAGNHSSVVVANERVGGSDL
ncbi:hypothetical protein NMY22_g11632 [Coprinellus aureogranulatus]|nr:hypothetical protein NMY22_g11632 [Coprinellus aureogranulatus]